MTAPQSRQVNQFGWLVNNFAEHVPGVAHAVVVSVDGVLQTLVERGLVEQVGVAEVIGRPKTFGTTPVFLEYFGLRNLEELPAADELRRIPVNKPDSLLTVDAGLATAPPEQLAAAPAEAVAEVPAPTDAAR